jgi:Carboxypeptidase regulatory-like domain
MARVPGTGIVIALASVLVTCATVDAAYRETPVTNGARIVGTVRVAGDVAPLPPQPVFKEKEFCGDGITDERLVVDSAGHLNCNVRHTWMHAYVFVTDDPYHSVTDGDGHFVLTDVPPGTYTIAVWHERLGSRERQVTVGPGETATVDFELEALAPEKP